MIKDHFPDHFGGIDATLIFQCKHNFKDDQIDEPFLQSEKIEDLSISDPDNIVIGVDGEDLRGVIPRFSEVDDVLDDRFFDGPLDGLSEFNDYDLNH